MLKTGSRYIVVGLMAGVIVAYVLFAGLAGVKPSHAPIQTVYAEEEFMTPYAEAEKVQNAFRQVSARILPSIVEVTVQSEGSTQKDDEADQPWNDFFVNPLEENGNPRFFQSHGLGSGIIIERRNDEYFVITNAHVIGNSEEIHIRLDDGTSLPVELAGKDERKDIALLKFSFPDHALSVIKRGNSDRIYIGDWVLAFGSPFGYAQSVSSGIISALGRQNGPGENINDFIQTDASINQGNSGGALVNIRGELIGINTFITTPNRGSIGLGFAIPVNNITRSLRQLIDDGKVRYGWLGVSLGAIGKEFSQSLGLNIDKGVMIYQVFDDSPASEAGLQPGDLIISLDSHPVKNSERLVYMIGDKAPEDIALFTINRSGHLRVLEAVMGSREEEDAVRTLHGRAIPGFVPAPLVSDLRQEMQLPESVNGVLVADVYPRTYAQSVDLRAGDIIVAVNDNLVFDIRTLYEAIAPSATTSPVYTVYRNGETIILERNLGMNHE